MIENAKKWVVALRSGEFTQGTGSLERDGKNCCMGVACRLYQEDVGDLRITSLANAITFDGLGGYPPQKVQEWLGLKSHRGDYGFECESLVSANDSGKTFTEIADIIESESDTLFRVDLLND